MKIDVIQGNLIDLASEGRYTAIGHGCNCFHTMGAGIAKSLNHATDRKLLKADKRTVLSDINKLGTFTRITHAFHGKEVRVYNLYTQYDFNRASSNVPRVHWNSVYDSLLAMIDDIPETNHEIKIGIPVIGCGLAGGHIETFYESIQPLIKVVDRNITLEVVCFTEHQHEALASIVSE